MKNRAPKFKGFRKKDYFVGDVAKRMAHDGTTPLVRSWREGEPLIYHGSQCAVLSPAAALFAAKGAKACAEFLGSKDKFRILAPLIQARILQWQRLT